MSRIQAELEDGTEIFSIAAQERSGYTEEAGGRKGNSKKGRDPRVINSA